MTVIEMPVKLLKFFFSTDLEQSKEVLTPDMLKTQF